jgi:hypothetical protein
MMVIIMIFMVASTIIIFVFIKIKLACKSRSGGFSSAGTSANNRFAVTNRFAVFVDLVLFSTITIIIIAVLLLGLKLKLLLLLLKLQGAEDKLVVLSLPLVHGNRWVHWFLLRGLGTNTNDFIWILIICKGCSHIFWRTNGTHIDIEFIHG